MNINHGVYWTKRLLQVLCLVFIKCITMLNKMIVPSFQGAWTKRSSLVFVNLCTKRLLQVFKAFKQKDHGTFLCCKFCNLADKEIVASFVVYWKKNSYKFSRLCMVKSFGEKDHGTLCKFVHKKIVTSFVLGSFSFL